jgi:uncharacterized membrane protein YcfT
MNNFSISLLLSTVHDKIILSLIITVVGFSRKLLSSYYDDTDNESTELKDVSQYVAANSRSSLVWYHG